MIIDAFLFIFVLLFIHAYNIGVQNGFKNKGNNVFGFSSRIQIDFKIKRRILIRSLIQRNSLCLILKLKNEL